MSVRRLVRILEVPAGIKKVFNSALIPVSDEERLWRERAARMTSDALGFTNLTTKPARHDEVVRYARRWFRGLFNDHPILEFTDSPEATFDAAGLVDFGRVRDAVLAFEPLMLDV